MQLSLIRVQAADDAWAQCWHAMLAFVWRVLSGVVIGVPVGYLSYLALDACTPRGLPLIA